MADAAAGRRAPLLVFVHIPKTAGTTFTTILTLNEPGPRLRHGGNVFKGGGGVKPGVKFENLLRNTNGELDRARVIAGHFPLAIRDHLPKDREPRFFTLLRDPADRTLSHYFQLREKPERTEPNRLGLQPLPKGATLDDALEAGYLHDNVHTRMLSGLPEPFGELDESVLDLAKQNLRDELVFFGLTERFDESLVLAKQRLGLRCILSRQSAGNGARSHGRASGRVNTTRPRGADVPEELRRAAEGCNRYDIELYRYAQQLFDDAPERGELEFQIELAALTAAQAEGAIDLDVPPPAGYGGDEEAWRMLLHARGTAIRQERELAGLKTFATELAERDREIVEELERIRAAGKSAAGRDAETATRVIQMLTPARAGKARAGEPTVRKRRLSAMRMAEGDASGGRAARKRRKRDGGESGDG